MNEINILRFIYKTHFKYVLYKDYQSIVIDLFI